MPKIDIETQIIDKLMQALGPQAKDPKARASLLPQVLLKMAGITETVENALFLPIDKTKISYADAIVHFVITLKAETANLFVRRFNELFPLSAKIINDTGPTVHIALSKQLLSSEKFINAFRESHAKPDSKAVAKENNYGIVHSSSPLFAIAGTDEKPATPKAQNTQPALRHP